MTETLCEGDIMFISVIKELCPGRSAQRASAIGKYKHMGWIDGRVGSLAKQVQLWKQRGKKKRELLETEYNLKGSSFKKAKEGQKQPELKPGMIAAQHNSDPVQCEEASSLC